MYPMIPPPRVERPKKKMNDYDRPRPPIAALVLAILGSLLAVAAGVFLLLAFILPENLAENRMAMDLLRNPNVPEEARNTMRMTFGRLRALPYFLLASAALGILGGIMTLGRRRRWGGAFMLLAALAPAVMFAALAWVHPQGFREQSPVITIAVLVGIPCLLLLIGGLNALLARPRLVNVPESEDEEPLPNQDGPPPLPPLGSDEPDIVEPELCLSLAPKRSRGLAITMSTVAFLFVAALAAVTLGLADRLLIGDVTVQQQPPLAIGDPRGLFNPPAQPEENPGPGKLPEANAAEAAERAARLEKRLRAHKAHEDTLIDQWRKDAGQDVILRVFLGRGFQFQNQLAISADGNLLVVHNYDEIVAWDVQSGAVKWQVRDDDLLFGIAISPDGKLLAAVHHRKTVLRDLRSGELLRTLPDHNNMARSLAFSPDSRLLSAGLPLWDVQSGENLTFLPREQFFYQAMEFTPQGDVLIVSNSGGDSVVAYEHATGRRITRLGNRNEGGSLLALSPDGRLLAVGGLRGNVPWRNAGAAARPASPGCTSSMN